MSVERRRLSLDDLTHEPGRVADLKPGERETLLKQCAAVFAVLVTADPQESAAGPDRLLTVAEVALQTSMSRDYIYRNARALPFYVDVAGARSLRFSAAKLARWMADGRR